MSGFLARLVARARGDGEFLQPVFNRWSISRASEVRDEAAAYVADDAGESRETPAAAPVRNAAVAPGASAVDEPRKRSRESPKHPDATPVRDQRRNDDRRVLELPSPVTSTWPSSEVHRPPAVVAQAAPPASGAPRAQRLLPLQPPTKYPASRAAELRPSLPTVEERPEVTYVHIGRIDVRAVDAPVPKPAPTRSAMRAPTLEAHLRARDRGRS